LGQVKQDFLADLLLVKGDPLTNPKVLLDRDNLRVIMKDGQFHKRSI
jgi:imidazolonepropionase-like amidohydrolase